MLLSIAGGSDLGLFEINEAAALVAEAAHADANIIFGAVIDDALGDEVRVTVIAAGFDGGMPKRRDQASRRYAASARPASPPPRPTRTRSQPTPHSEPVAARQPVSVGASVAGNRQSGRTRPSRGGSSSTSPTAGWTYRTS